MVGATCIDRTNMATRWPCWDPAWPGDDTARAKSDSATLFELVARFVMALTGTNSH